MTKAIAALVTLSGLATGATAQPTLINISGATLLESFFQAPASSNDFLDLDGDGNTLGDQLAPAPITALNGTFAIQQASVGSGNGIRDLDRAGAAVGFVTGTQAMPMGGILTSPEDGVANREAYNAGGTNTALANPLNPRGLPVRSLNNGSYTATLSSDDATTGIQIDLAPTDVPIAWFITQDGTPSFDATPGSAGYGNNGIISVGRFSGAKDGRANSLATLENTAVAGSANPNNLPEIFGTSLTSAPVAFYVNYGTGISEIDQSDLRYGYISGRLPSGENIAFNTRDSGSGTRNAAMNGICLDPSYGMGDNYGPRASSSTTDLIGPNFQGTNKGGSSRMDASNINSRLAIGYSGAERAFNRGYIIADGDDGNQDMEVLGITFDVYGGNSVRRPTALNIVDNTPGDGYHVIAPSSIGSIGDPTVPAGQPGAMANQGAADYLNNITASINAFAGSPGEIETLFSPGEFLALNFIPAGTTDFIDGPAGACDLVLNTNLNQTLQDFVVALSVLSESEYATFNSNATGRVPNRTTGFVYSDGVANGANYVTEAGTVLAYGTDLNIENKIAFDFNVDGVRDINDAAALVEAYDARYNGGTWTGNSAVSFEILGDANGDGNFDLVDMYTAADGLLVNASTRTMERRAAFQAVDNAAGGNFFGTTLASGAAYPAGSGFSAADLTGAADRAPTPGYHLAAADGVIDLQDVDYIAKQFVGLADGAFTWGDDAEACFPTADGCRRDLSGDMNDDQQVNKDDVLAVLAWLDVEQGDLDLDGDVDGDDEAIVIANQGQMNVGYSQGDLNCDGVVDGDDLAFFQVGGLCADQNNDGILNGADFNAWLANFAAGSPDADVNRDGNLNGADFNAWLAAFSNGIASGVTCD